MSLIFLIDTDNYLISAGYFCFRLPRQVIYKGCIAHVHKNLYQLFNTRNWCTQHLVTTARNFFYSSWVLILKEFVTINFDKCRLFYKSLLSDTIENYSILGENRHRREAGRPAAKRWFSCGFRICVFTFGSVFAYYSYWVLESFCARNIRVFVSGSVCEGSVKTVIIRSVYAPDINLFSEMSVQWIQILIPGIFFNILFMTFINLESCFECLILSSGPVGS